MADPINVDEIGLRFTENAWRGKGRKSSARTFVGFVLNPENLKILFPDIPPTNVSDNQAHELVIEYLGRFWSPDRMCTAIITNISMEEKQKLFLVRPVLEGAVTAGYGTPEKGIPAFRCIVQHGYFLAVGCEVDFFPDSGPEQITLVGLVYTQKPPPPGEVLEGNRTRPPKPLPPNVLDTISNLKSKRLFVSRKVKEWFAFIDWVRNIVCQKQIGLRYSSVEVDKSSQCLRFTISASSDQWEKLIK